MTHDAAPALYCNPLPLPDYPRGRACCGKKNPANWLWRQPQGRDFRETADPSVLYEDGKWYLYPSAGMAYVSEDFCTWKHVRIEPYDCGYAPTVVKFRDTFLLTACGAPLYRADSPLGPFKEVGRLVTPGGEKPRPGWADPMLFADDDDRLYAYWGLGDPGIFAAELDPDQPHRMRTEPQKLFAFNPDHVWERFGEWNENAALSFCEGAWMVKVEGRYFLTYAAPGTQFSTYAMGTYVSDSPLGPFEYQQRNPILTTTQGLVRGPGHGCIVPGPNGTLWAFYTCCLCYEHAFERRIGMDPAGLDEQGNLFVAGATEIPQLAPGAAASPEAGNGAGLLPCNHMSRCFASSSAPGREPIYCTDRSTITWWQAGDADRRPALEFELKGRFEISATRLWWRDQGLDYDGGVVPGPFQYRLEGKLDDGDWFPVLDRSDSDDDLLIDFQVFTRKIVTGARLTITGWPRGITPALIDCTLFGKHVDV